MVMGSTIDIHVPSPILLFVAIILVRHSVKKLKMIPHSGKKTIFTDHTVDKYMVTAILNLKGWLCVCMS